MAQRVLITGGGSGIGYAMAQAFGSVGAQVWVTDIDQTALDYCPKDCFAAKPTWPRRSSHRPVCKYYKDLGRIRCAMFKCGDCRPTAMIEDMPLEGFQACIGVNLQGAFLATRAAAPLMKAQKAGVIIYTSSTSGIHGHPNRAPYAAAKWGTNGIMKTVAMELGPFGIRANSICPGAVEGPRIERVLEKEAELKGTSRDAIYQGYAAGTSMRSFVTAQDVANMAVFLASDGARMVSGQIIAVDGHTENPDPKI